MLTSFLLLTGTIHSHAAATEDSSATRPVGSIPPTAEAFQITVLATSLSEPIQLSPAADGRVYFAERTGTIKVWQPTTQITVTLGRLTPQTNLESGVLGLALDPGFLTNHWLYLFHSTPGVFENRVSRFSVNGDALDLASQKILLHIPTEHRGVNHLGGGLGFDQAGNLYASVGDNTIIDSSDGYSPMDERPDRQLWDSQRTAANTRELRGKILRIQPQPDGTYTIPPGNLFPADGSQGLPEIYLMGVRNPFRFTIDPKTSWLYFGDVGPDANEMNPRRGPVGLDEFNQARKAGNFGWPYFLGDNRPYVKYDFATKVSGEPFDPAHPVNHSTNNTGLHALPPAEPAMIYYPYGLSARFPGLGSGARSAMAGPVYHFDPQLKSDRKLPAYYDNCWFIFDWERGWINAARLDANGKLLKIEPFLPLHKFKRPISLALALDGALYLLEWGSNWYHNLDSQLVRIESRK